MSRKLDALVAERVENWRWMKYQAPNYSTTRLLTALFPPDAPNRICVPNGYDRIWQPSNSREPRFSGWDSVPWWEDGERQSGFPHYSTDIAAAWMVVEKMRADGWWMELRHCLDGGVPAWQCELTHNQDRFRGLRLYISAASAPFAISLAALRAVGVTEDEIKAALEDDK